MAILTIKDIPEPLYRRLKAQAEVHRRSLNREVIVCLERAVVLPPLEPDALLARADALRRRLALRSLTPAQLRAARAVGRR